MFNSCSFPVRLIVKALANTWRQRP